MLAMLSALSLAGQQHILQPQKRVSSSFAVFVDTPTFNECEDELMAYRDVLADEGLSVYLLHADWESPEHVKFFIDKYYKEQNLEGAVFIGNIPVVMVRKAQHLTSAFKMNERNFPMFESSVPSDRYYDDLDLKFDFVCRDSLHDNIYYYNLAADSPQYLACDIYTGRIKAVSEGAAGYEEIRAYLRKAVEAHKSANVLDRVVSYTGEGSFSNSIMAWKDESVTMREQIPSAFRDSDGAKFYLYDMYPYVKDVVVDELRRKDLDLMLFHEHGMPERQYLSVLPSAGDIESRVLQIRRGINEALRKRDGNRDEIEAYEEKMSSMYGLDSSWFVQYGEKAVIENDSLLDRRTGIFTDEIYDIKPEAKVVIFDACYNGDFRNRDFIAGRYIMSEGGTVACFANSANVLQDKSSTDLMGLLACGFRMGEWTKHINILESHIIGDPTFRFAKPDKLPEIKLNQRDTSYWKAVFSHNLPADIRSLALYKLHELEYERMSDFLYYVYENSEDFTMRLQALHLSPYYNDGNYVKILKSAMDDPYEFIRRKAVFYMGKVGRSDLLYDIVRLYFDDYYSKRVAFNVSFVTDHFDYLFLSKVFYNEMKKRDYIYDDSLFRNELESKLKSSSDMVAECLSSVLDESRKLESRLFYISMLRNKPVSFMVDDILCKIEDENAPLEVRVALAEALGWYVRSCKRNYIADWCRSILETESLPAELSEELIRTVNRLEVYLR